MKICSLYLLVILLFEKLYGRVQQTGPQLVRRGRREADAGCAVAMTVFK
jgi:hypothetical protein